MIRKFLFSVLLISAGFTTVNAQCTADTSLKIPGFYPITLPAATVDVAYDQSISVLAFRDTSITIGTTKIAVKVDSIKATGMLGLPSGFSYKCLHPRCVFVWTEVRCVSIFGTTNKNGLYPIQIPIIAYGKIGGTTPVNRPDTLRNFAIQVNGGTNSIVKFNNGALNIFPNPSSGNVHVYVPNDAKAENLDIIDVSGRVCATFPVNKTENLQTLSLQLPLGSYVVKAGFYSTQLILVP